MTDLGVIKLFKAVCEIMKSSKEISKKVPGIQHHIQERNSVKEKCKKNYNIVTYERTSVNPNSHHTTWFLRKGVQTFALHSTHTQVFAYLDNLKAGWYPSRLKCVRWIWWWWCWLSSSGLQSRGSTFSRRAHTQNLNQNQQHNTLLLLLIISEMQCSGSRVREQSFRYKCDWRVGFVNYSFNEIKLNKLHPQCVSNMQNFTNSNKALK